LEFVMTRTCFVYHTRWCDYMQCESTSTVTTTTT